MANIADPKFREVKERQGGRHLRAPDLFRLDGRTIIGIVSIDLQYFNVNQLANLANKLPAVLASSASSRPKPFSSLVATLFALIWQLLPLRNHGVRLSRLKT